MNLTKTKINSIIRKINNDKHILIKKVIGQYGFNKLLFADNGLFEKKYYDDSISICYSEETIKKNINKFNEYVHVLLLDNNDKVKVLSQLSFLYFDALDYINIKTISKEDFKKYFDECSDKSFIFSKYLDHKYYVEEYMIKEIIFNNSEFVHICLDDMIKEIVNINIKYETKCKIKEQKNKIFKNIFKKLIVSEFGDKKILNANINFSYNINNLINLAGIIHNTSSKALDFKMIVNKVIFDDIKSSFDIRFGGIINDSDRCRNLLFNLDESIINNDDIITNIYKIAHNHKFLIELNLWKKQYGYSSDTSKLNNYYNFLRDDKVHLFEINPYDKLDFLIHFYKDFTKEEFLNEAIIDAGSDDIYNFLYTLLRSYNNNILLNPDKKDVKYEYLLKLSGYFNDILLEQLSKEQVNLLKNFKLSYFDNLS